MKTTVGFLTLATVLLMGAAAAEPAITGTAAAQSGEALVSSLLTGGGAGALVLVFLWRQLEQLRAQVGELAASLAHLSAAVERLERHGCERRCDTPAPNGERS